MVKRADELVVGDKIITPAYKEKIIIKSISYPDNDTVYVKWETGSFDVAPEREISLWED